MFVSDGGMKIHRKICGAKFSGVTTFDHSDYNILSGCQKIPTPGSKFCSDHEHEKTPCIDKVTEKTKETLDRKDQFDNDDIFIIESIVEMKPKEVLVKWAGFDTSTWEPKDNIPEWIVHFYQDPKKLSKPLPNPYIKHIKRVGKGQTYYLLSWEGGDGEEEWLDESLINMYTGAVEDSISSCNTVKDKDKRILRHSCGILISVYTCGIIPHFDELIRLEGRYQVGAMVAEWLGSLPPAIMNRITTWLYDDM